MGGALIFQYSHKYNITIINCNITKWLKSRGGSKSGGISRVPLLYKILYIYLCEGHNKIILCKCF